MPLLFARTIKKLNRRFGVAAPRVVIRPYVSWWWSGLGLCLLLTLSLILLQTGSFSGDEEVLHLREQLRLQREELMALQSVAGTEQNQVRMERSSKESILAKAEALERENSLLKEDLRLFERLYADPGEVGGVRVESVKLSSGQDGRYHFRVMLSFRPTGQIRDFRGRLEYKVLSQRAGRIEDVSALVLAGAELKLEVKNFLRREGGFVLPEGARLKSFEVKVWQGDTLKAQRLAQI